MSIKYQNSDNKGFTLVELIIVIAIMAVWSKMLLISIHSQVDSIGQIHLGASASNAQRTDHAKDEDAATLFAQKLGFTNAKVTPVGQQYTGN